VFQQQRKHQHSIASISSCHKLERSAYIFWFHTWDYQRLGYFINKKYQYAYIATPSCTLRGHTTAVNCFGIFPDEQDQRIASGSNDTFIKLWDVRQKENYAVLKQHAKQINSIDISPNGLFLLSGSEDGTTKFWDLRSYGKVLSTYAEHSGPIIKAIFHPDDCVFASCSSDKTVKCFSCDESKGIYHYLSSTDLVSMPITSIDFNINGSLLCLACNNTLRICNMEKNGVLVESL
jgi:WD40 repeat protein